MQDRTRPSPSRWTGTATDQWSSVVPGDTVGIRFSAPAKVWGFNADQLYWQ